MKHKHADLIHAWADGAEIQYFHRARNEWIDDPDPLWILDNQYRIKPEEKKPVVRWLWADKHGYYTEDRLSPCAFGSYTIKLKWSRTEFPE